MKCVSKNYSTEEPCLACGISTENGNTFHHVKTRGSGGPDADWNMMPLCQTHHVQVHANGLTHFAGKYAQVKRWLLRNEWEFVEMTQKWSHFDKNQEG